jgi:hypothetical protein
MSEFQVAWRTPLFQCRPDRGRSALIANVQSGCEQRFDAGASLYVNRERLAICAIVFASRTVSPKAEVRPIWFEAAPGLEVRRGLLWFDLVKKLLPVGFWTRARDSRGPDVSLIFRQRALFRTCPGQSTFEPVPQSRKA